MIRVAVADDQALVRSGFAVLLRSADDIEVVGEAATGAEAIDLVLRERPDVVLMDIRMPEVDGLEATRAITERGLETRVLILTTFDLDEYVYGALQAGASGFLLKDTRRLIEQFARQATVPTPRDPAFDTLTERENEVLLAVARGLSNAELADELYMSPATAKTHVSRLLAKLHARDRAQLVMLAYEAGLVTPGASG